MLAPCGNNYTRWKNNCLVFAVNIRRQVVVAFFAEVKMRVVALEILTTNV